MLTSGCDALLLQLSWKQVRAQLNAVWHMLHAIIWFMHRAGSGMHSQMLPIDQ